MRRLCKAIIVLLVLFASFGVFGASTDSTYSSIAVNFVSRIGVAAGFSNSQVTGVNPVTATGGLLTGTEVNFVYDDANRRFESDEVFYYLQIFIPDPIEFSVSCGPLVDYTTGTTVIPVSNMTMNVGTHTASGNASANPTTLVWTLNEKDNPPDEFADVTDASGNVTKGTTREYPTVYSESIDVRVPAEYITTSAKLKSTLTLSVKVLT